MKNHNRVDKDSYSHVQNASRGERGYQNLFTERLGLPARPLPKQMTAAPCSDALPSTVEDESEYIFVSFEGASNLRLTGEITAEVGLGRHAHGSLPALMPPCPLLTYTRIC